MTLLPSGNKFPESSFKGASLKENTVLAHGAFYAYISANSEYLPLIAAAGMLFLETNYITELYLHIRTVIPSVLLSHRTVGVYIVAQGHGSFSCRLGEILTL